MPDRERTLDETEAGAVRCLTEMLDYFCVGEQLRPIKPRREDVLRLVEELPEDRVEAAWQALVALL